MRKYDLDQNDDNTVVKDMQGENKTVMESSRIIDDDD